MTRINKILIPFCICIILVLGCTESAKEPEPNSTKEEIHLKIGLIPERNIFKQTERYEPLADYISKKIGAKIELKVLTRYGNIIDNFISLGLDAAFFGSFTYTLANAKLGVEVVARPIYESGISTYHGLIFVRKGSGIKGIKDMKGKIFVFVDKATTAGYVLPLAYFKKYGVEDYKTFLKETYFAGTHEDAIYDVINNKADIGAAKNTIFYRLANKDSRITNNLVILERSPDVPENGLAVNKNLDKSIKKKLKQALLNMHNDPEGIVVLKNFGAKGFIETTDNDYKSVHQFTQEIGLNLKTYDYIND